MIKIFMSFRQITMVLLPILIITIVYFNKEDILKYSKNIVPNNILQFTSNDLNKAIKDSINKRYYKDIELIKNNYLNIYRSTYDIDKDTTLWSIAYIFQSVEDKVEVKKDQIKSLNTIQKYKKLQGMVDQRNKTIEENLNIVKKPYINILNGEDIKKIKGLIALRGLNISKNNSKKEMIIDYTKYKLQSIFIGKTKQVIINGEIYKIYDKIDDKIKIIDIKNNKVLLKSIKGKKWIYLNN